MSAATSSAATVLVEPVPKSVHAALSAVIAELPSIGKDDRAPQGYAYRGIEAITRHLQPLLAKHGVVIVPRAEVLGTVPSPAMKEGWQDVSMRVEWDIYGPDGSCVEAVTNGIGRDNSDKGSNKAQTQAYKYLLLHLLCIADGKDDSDSHTYEHGRADSGLKAGEMWAKEAKERLLVACGDDRDAAAAAWKQAGLDGRTAVTDAELQGAFAVVNDGATGNGAPAPGHEAGEAVPEPGPNDTGEGAAAVAPDPDRPLSIRDVAIKADAVFDEASSAAPKGKKNKTQRALRHALVYAATAGRAQSLNDLNPAELLVVYSQLVAIEAGSVTFDADLDPFNGVTFDWGDGDTTSVQWTELEPAKAGAT